MALAITHVRKIEVSLETYDRLKRRAVPFEDTPDTVIAKLLDESAPKCRRPVVSDRRPAEYDDGSGQPPMYAGGNVDVTVKDPFDPPSLKHAKVLRAMVDGREVVKANWTNVRQSVVTIALGEGGYDLRQLLQVCPMNAVEGVKDDEGYAHYEHLGISIQGQDANHAWQATASTAQALGVPVKVWFQWRAKPDAAHPGKWGLLTVGQAID